MLTCAALILNHNGRVLLPPLYASLLRQERLDAIVLIDNASTDDSIELTRSISTRIEIDRNEENLDFGTAYNRAIAKRGEDVVLILNNDTVVHNHAIKRCLEFLEQHPEVASVSLTGVAHDLPGGYPSKAQPLVRFGRELCPLRIVNGPDEDVIISPGFLWGAACCVRREIFEQVRFDEDLNWYFEDIDLGWSITRTTGLLNVFLASATFYHF